MIGTLILVWVVRASGCDFQMLGPRKPAWNKAWSGWSGWSKHFFNLINRNNDFTL